MKKIISVSIDNHLHTELKRYSEEYRKRIDSVVEDALNLLIRGPKGKVEDKIDVKDPLQVKFKQVDKRVNRKRKPKPKKETVEESMDNILKPFE